MKPIIATALFALAGSAGTVSAAELDHEVLNFPAAAGIEGLTDQQISRLNQLVHSGDSPGEINSRIHSILN